MTGSRSSLAREVPRSPEEQPLKGGREDGFPGLTRYGSILGTPPENILNPVGRHRERKPPELELPDPALDPNRNSPRHGPANAPHDAASKSPALPPSAGDSLQVGKTRSTKYNSSSLPFRYKSIFTPKRVNSTPVFDGPRPLLQKVMSFTGRAHPTAEDEDVPLEAFKELDVRQEEFFRFLLDELLSRLGQMMPVSSGDFDLHGCHSFLLAMPA